MQLFEIIYITPVTLLRSELVKITLKIQPVFIYVFFTTKLRCVLKLTQLQLYHIINLLKAHLALFLQLTNPNLILYANLRIEAVVLNVIQLCF